MPQPAQGVRMDRLVGLLPMTAGSAAGLSRLHARTTHRATRPGASSEFDRSLSIRLKLKAWSEALFELIGRPAPLLIQYSPRGIVRVANAVLPSLALRLSPRSITNNSSLFRTSRQWRPALALRIARRVRDTSPGGRLAISRPRPILASQGAPPQSQVNGVKSTSDLANEWRRSSGTCLERQERRQGHLRPAQASPSGPLPVLTSPVTVIVFKSITATASREFSVVYA
jgi:hypothetical protein